MAQRYRLKIQARHIRSIVEKLLIEACSNQNPLQGTMVAEQENTSEFVDNFHTCTRHDERKRCSRRKNGISSCMKKHAKSSLLQKQKSKFQYWIYTLKASTLSRIQMVGHQIRINHNVVRTSFDIATSVAFCSCWQINHYG